MATRTKTYKSSLDIKSHLIKYGFLVTFCKSISPVPFLSSIDHATSFADTVNCCAYWKSWFGEIKINTITCPWKLTESVFGRGLHDENKSFCLKERVSVCISSRLRGSRADALHRGARLYASVRPAYIDIRPSSSSSASSITVCLSYFQFYNPSARTDA